MLLPNSPRKLWPCVKLATRRWRYVRRSCGPTASRDAGVAAGNTPATTPPPPFVSSKTTSPNGAPNGYSDLGNEGLNASAAADSENPSNRDTGGRPPGNNGNPAGGGQGSGRRRSRHALSEQERSCAGRPWPFRYLSIVRPSLRRPPMRGHRLGRGCKESAPFAANSEPPDQNFQQRKNAFIDAHEKKPPPPRDSQQRFPGPTYALNEGTSVQLSLLTGINTDLPGKIRAKIRPISTIRRPAVTSLSLMGPRSWAATTALSLMVNAHSVCW